jgi:hypothetical protein
MTIYTPRKCLLRSISLPHAQRSKWPFGQFRKELLNDSGSLFVDQEGRWQVLNASLNGIKLALTGAQRERTRGRKREWVFEAPPVAEIKRAKCL